MAALYTNGVSKKEKRDNLFLYKSNLLEMGEVMTNKLLLIFVSVLLSAQLFCSAPSTPRMQIPQPLQKESDKARLALMICGKLAIIKYVMVKDGDIQPGINLLRETLSELKGRCSSFEIYAMENSQESEIVRACNFTEKNREHVSSPREIGVEGNLITYRLSLADGDEAKP